MLGRAEVIPFEGLKRDLPLADVIEEIALPRAVVFRRWGETAYGQTLRAVPYVLSALVMRYGFIPPELTARDIRFITTMVLWRVRNDAIKEIEQFYRNKYYEDPPDMGA